MGAPQQKRESHTARAFFGGQNPSSTFQVMLNPSVSNLSTAGFEENEIAASNKGIKARSY